MAKYQSLTQFISQLESDSTHGEWVSRHGEFPFVAYSDVAHNLRDAIYSFVEQFKEVDFHGYADILESYGLAWDNKSLKEHDVANADAKLVVAMLVGILRADRFCEGFYFSCLESGRILVLLKRLQEVDEA